MNPNLQECNNKASEKLNRNFVTTFCSWILILFSEEWMDIGYFFNVPGVEKIKWTLPFTRCHFMLS